MNFVGSKGGEGIAQWIISAMPLHTTYVECFLGKGVVYKTKIPAEKNILIEFSQKVISNYWAGHIDECMERNQSCSLYTGNALAILPTLNLSRDALVYADPPYLMESRSCHRNYYDHELSSVEDHTLLLSILKALPCCVMLSGYQSDLYCRELSGWRTSWKWTVNRRGKLVKEWLWMNFPEPTFFHDTRFVGTDFTDRQRIKRKAERWQSKFVSMPSGEKMAVLDALLSVVDDRSQSEISTGSRESKTAIPAGDHSQI